jgi:TonB family protein
MPLFQSLTRSSFSARAGLNALAALGTFTAFLAFNNSLIAQQSQAQASGSALQSAQPAIVALADPHPAPVPNASQPAAQPTANVPATVPASTQTKPQPQTEPQSETLQALPGEITENELKQLLVGKPLYLRGGYLDNSLAFNEHGALIDRSPQGSYTLNGIEIDKVRLTKHKVELEGSRYGLHFLGSLSYGDPANAADRIKITPKKKVVKITIDREQVVVPKKKNDNPAQTAIASKPAPPVQPTAAGPEKAAIDSIDAAQAAPPASNATPDASAAAIATTDIGQTSSEPEQNKLVAATSPADDPADPASVTTTVSPAHAASVLKSALDRIFAFGIDDRLIASLPDYWKLYYQAVAANADYRPSDPSVLRQSAVDNKARLLSTFQPESNQYAQDNAVSGMALYHTVIGPDGKPQEIAVGRPIGFGLDESAVAAIRKADFEPAMKDGKPVAVVLDLVVQFHIYSKRTAASGNPEEASKQAAPSLPGPYSLLPQ